MIYFLDFIGAFLYFMYRVITLPVLLLLYSLWGLWLAVKETRRFTNSLYQHSTRQAAMLYRQLAKKYHLKNGLLILTGRLMQRN